MISNKLLWSIWILFSLALAAGMVFKLLNGEDKSLYLPGNSTNGHYQIEQQCDLCHAEGFDTESLQKSCVKCHKAELKQAEDSHPRSKFTDPRNADRIAILDARYCVSCHREHSPEQTVAYGVTLPEDYCFKCHDDVGKNRPSHKGMKFDTCDDAGCHNYHDNKALYEDFLVQHANEAETDPKARLPERNSLALYIQNDRKQKHVEQRNNISPGADTLAIVRTWKQSAHYAAAVNCKACHEAQQPIAGDRVCEQCHQREFSTHASGKHGFKRAQTGIPMRADLARLKMHANIKQPETGCHSCHQPHKYDTSFAAVDACLNCHNDLHSRQYKLSSHFTIGTGNLKPIVTCANCHLPREEFKVGGGRKRIRVNHNQNFNLQPNEKMIRSVCLQCHSLAFSIDALADSELVANNFTGRPSQHINSIEMAVAREKTKPSQPKE